MSDQIAVFSERDIATRERLEDYAADAIISTEGGLHIQVAIACDGAGGGEVGEMAARLTARTIMEHMEISEVHNVPQLLIDSVEEANRVVFNELKGTGTSTVAMIAIDLDDKSGPYGRMYIASVGDSRVYLMREGQLVRLNIDHTLANEYVHAGQMSREEAERFENANYPTRMIGVGAEVQVDIGFYVERGRGFVNAQRAFNIGRNGLILQEGDTVFAASDGMFRTNEEGKPFVQDDEFLRHALDDDVERAARNIMRYAAARHPDDNTALSLVFVPSRQRRAVRIGAGLTRTQRAGLATLILAFLMVIAFFGINWASSESERLILYSTQEAIREIALALSATPTFTPTATPTATITPTPTPTLRPTAVAGQVAFQYLADKSTIPIFPGRRITHSGVNQLIVDGENAPDDFIPANVFLQPNAILEIQTVINTSPSERFEFIIHPDSDVYVNAGDFANSGSSANIPQPVNVASRVLGAQSLDDTGMKITLSQSPDFYFEANTSCIAAKQIPPDPLDASDTEKVAFTCFDGATGDCAYHLPGDGDLTQMRIGSRVVLDVDTEEWVEDGPIQYDEVKTYYDTIVTMESSTDLLLSCAGSYLDADGDTVLYPDDQCEFEAGSVAAFGCPDQDSDGIVDDEDECPLEAGTIDFKGCPPPTATALPDSDSDGINDVEDACPFDPTNTCPEITQTIEAQITAGTVVAAVENNTATPNATATVAQTATETLTPTVSPTPSNTSFPTRTPFASSTPIQPTSVPPTSVPATSVPATSVPATSAPATDVPATSVPATSVPTSVPATSVPATDVPATSVPATSVPPTAVPPTDVPPTSVPVPTNTPIPIPVANFTRSINGLVVQFTDTSSNNPTQWSWNFGDPASDNDGDANNMNTSTQQSPSHRFSGTGTYTVTLTVTGPGGSNSISKTVNVTKPPSANFTHSANGLAVTFTDTTTDAPTSWSWDFGDGNTSTSQSPQHTYTTSNSYTVTLTASNAGGSSTTQKTVTVLAKPQANFTFSRNGNQVTVVDASTGGTPTSWSWDFGDGSTANVQNPPTHTYGSNTTFTISLTVTNASGSSSTSQQVTVAALPTASFTWSSTNLGTSLNGTGSTNAASYSWNFGDNSTGGGATPSHTYALAGNYTVTLTVTNSAGDVSAPVSQTVTVIQAGFTFSYNSGTQVKFNNTTAAPSTPTYSWNFGDPPGSTDASPVKDYPNTPKNYSVTLTATLGAATSSVTQTVNVAGSPPEAGFNCALSGLTITCTDSSTNSPTKWTWDFGDSNGSNAQNPTHTYAGNGSYTVKLVAENAAGPSTNNPEQVIDITIPPVVAFSCTVSGLTITCTNNTTNCADAGCTTEAWLWNFGDSTTATTKDATYTYAAPGGTFTVTLTAANVNGGGQAQQSVTVAP